MPNTIFRIKLWRSAYTHVMPHSHTLTATVSIAWAISRPLGLRAGVGAHGGQLIDWLIVTLQQFPIITTFRIAGTASRFFDSRLQQIVIRCKIFQRQLAQLIMRIVIRWTVQFYVGVSHRPAVLQFNEKRNALQKFDHRALRHQKCQRVADTGWTHITIQRWNFWTKHKQAH